MTFYYDSVPSGTAVTSMLEGWVRSRELGVRGAKVGNWSDEERKSALNASSASNREGHA